MNAIRLKEIIIDKEGKEFHRTVNAVGTNKLRKATKDENGYYILVGKKKVYYEIPKMKTQSLKAKLNGLKEIRVNAEKGEKYGNVK